MQKHHLIELIKSTVAGIRNVNYGKISCERLRKYIFTDFVRKPELMGKNNYYHVDETDFAKKGREKKRGVTLLEISK